VNLTKKALAKNPKCLVVNLLDSQSLNAPTSSCLSYHISKYGLSLYTKSFAQPEAQVFGLLLGATLFKDGQKEDVFTQVQKQFQTSLADITKAIDNILANQVKNGNIIDLSKK
jgi:hypothetical protein